MKPLRVGLTGGIATGKTTVARIWETLRIPVYYADQAAKRLLSHPDLRPKVQALLGPETYLPAGQPNYAYIAQRIFSDDALRKQLEALIHPAVRDDFYHWVQQQNTLYVIHEAALLFESGFDKEMDWVVTVYARPETRARRNPQYRERAHLQLPEDEKTRRAHFVIYNDEDCALIPQVWKLHQWFLQQAAGRD